MTVDQERGPGGKARMHGQTVVGIELEAESAFAIEKVGDMSLFEPGLFGKTESGQFSGFNAVPKDLTEIFLQNFELHGREYSTGVKGRSKSGRMPETKPTALIVKKV